MSRRGRRKKLRKRASIYPRKTVWERMIVMKKQLFMPLDLQYFAEGGTDPEPKDPEPQDPPKSSEGGTDPEPKDPPKEPEKKYSDADVDKLINQKFAKWQKDSEEKLRQSQLSAEEKEKERIAKLEQLEKDVATRDAKDTARKALSEEKLPTEFADFVFDTQEDVAKEKMDNFKKLLASYRENVVNEVMRDKTPPKPNTTDKKTYDITKMSTQELRKLREEDPKKFKEITQQN